MKSIQLSVAVSAAVLVLSGVTAAAAPQPLTGHTPKFTQTSLDLGAAKADQPVHLRIWLKMRQSDQLASMAKAMSNPSSSQFARAMSQGEIDAAFKPAASDIAKVQNYLQAQGLKNVTVNAGHRFITAEATVASAQKLFQTEIHNFMVDKKIEAANTGDPVVDSSVADSIAYIGGLSTHKMRPMFVRQVDPDTGSEIKAVPFTRAASKTQHETVCFSAPETHTFMTAGQPIPSAQYAGNRYGSAVTAPAPNLPPCGYGPSEVQAAYGVDKLVAKGLDGSGQTIVIVDAFGSPTIEGDAAAFAQAYGLPAPNLTVLQPAGAPVTGAWNADQQGWSGETTLDVEWAHVMAPGAKIVLVEALSDSDDDLTAAIAYAVENGLGDQISNSWSGNESQSDSASIALSEAVLQTAVLKGVSVHFSSGDDGDLVAKIGYADVGYPSSSIYVTSVGGTSLALNADHSVRFQTGWGNNAVRLTDVAASAADAANDKNPPLDPPANLGFSGGSGGGTSRLFAKPSYQSKVAGTMRQQPDIAFLADPQTGVELVQSSFDADGNPQPGNLGLAVIGGTSLACPMFTALWAVANQAHGSSLGQAAPRLYKLPSSAIVDIQPIGSTTNVQGVLNDARGSNPLMSLQLGSPETAAPFYSVLYNSPISLRWLVLTFGTDTSLQTAKGWDNVTGLGVPNGEKFINALK